MSLVKLYKPLVFSKVLSELIFSPNILADIPGRLTNPQKFLVESKSHFYLLIFLYLESVNNNRNI